MSTMTRKGRAFLRLQQGEIQSSDSGHGQSDRHARSARRDQVPRSDIGTIFLHWTLATAIIVSLLTGLRLAADAEGSVVARSLDFMLPQGEIWTWHFVAALIVIAGIFAYGTYLSAARLKRRVSTKKTIILTLPASAKLRWSAFNVVLYWILFLAVIVLAVTGVLLYLGHGGLVVDIHYVSALFVASYIVVHVFSHYMYGGLQQLLRLFRPQPLRVYKGMSERPLAKALGLALVIAAIAAYADFGTRDTLVVSHVKHMPALDGSLDEPAWQNASPVFVRTQKGANLGGSGESTVEIRAVRTEDKVAFAFRWEDPTRSLKRLPLIKREDGWHMLHNRADIADETAYYEDKFAILFSHSNAFGNGGTTHMGPKPLADQPGALNDRGLHYTTDGSFMDVWQWKASRGGMLGKVDDMWFGPPVEANAKQRAGTHRYSAGYAGDKGEKFYVNNYEHEPPGGYRGPIKVKRLPVDYKATVARLGNIDLTPGASDDAGSQWWMFEHESVPYSAEHDATIPVGTVIPGIVIMGTYEGSRADLKGGSKWEDGYWTLEVERSLSTGYEQDLDIVNELYIYVSVFDQNQTRHTRHVRPVRLELR